MFFAQGPVNLPDLGIWIKLVFYSFPQVLPGGFARLLLCIRVWLSHPQGVRRPTPLRKTGHPVPTVSPLCSFYVLLHAPMFSHVIYCLAVLPPGRPLPGIQAAGRPEATALNG